MLGWAGGSWGITVTPAFCGAKAGVADEQAPRGGTPSSSRRWGSNIRRAPTLKDGVSRNTPGPDYGGLKRFLFSINKHSQSAAPSLPDGVPRIPLSSPQHLPPPRQGLPQGLGGWAWCWAWGPASPGPGTQLGSRLRSNPVTIYGHFQAPAVPAPDLPASQAHRQALGGALPWPCALLDARAQGRGGGGRFLQRPRASLSSPWDQRTTPQRKACLRPPWSHGEAASP